jgi:hypothetical protein
MNDITTELLNIGGERREVRVAREPSATYRWGVASPIHHVILPGGPAPSAVWIAHRWLPTRAAAFVYAQQRYPSGGFAISRWEG